MGTLKEDGLRVAPTTGGQTTALSEEAMMVKRSASLVGRTFGYFRVLSKAIRPVGSPNVHNWKCRCRCGRIMVRSTHVLHDWRRRGRSCGCYQRVDPYRKHLVQLIWKYKDGARERGLRYELTEKVFSRLTRSPCHYCGRSPSQILRVGKNDKHPIKYNGVDRKNNDHGYVRGNVVPCCKTCNTRKAAASYRSFLRWIRAVYATRAATR